MRQVDADLVDVTMHVDDAAGVATVSLDRPPNNHFDVPMIRSVADAAHRAAVDEGCGAVVLRAEGKHFCAGRDNSRDRAGGDSPAALYAQALRLVQVEIPIVAAVHGAAVGGGFGLAMVADFRVASRASRFWPNFASLGLHHGFGLTVTLPAAVGSQRAAQLLYTGARLDGTAAAAMGVVDHLVDDDDDILPAATDLAVRIAAGAPLAVRAMRRTMRRDLPERFGEATALELAAQERLRSTHDYAEGVAAVAERRTPRFRGA